MTCTIPVRVRPRQVPVEDVPAGQAQFAFQVERGLGLDARPPVPVEGQAVGDRLGEMGVELGEGGGQQDLARALVVLLEQPRRGVQAEQRQGLVPLLDQLRPEDRRVGQRVAVDLRGRYGGQFPGGRLGMRPRQLGVPLGDVEGAAERLARIHRGVPQPGQPPQQHVDLELCPFGGGQRRLLAEQFGQGPRRGVDEHGAADDPPLTGRGAEGHLGRCTAVGVDPQHLVPGGELRPGRPRGLGQGVRQRAHAADRDVPVAGAAADHVVQEAAVLDERGVVRVGERSDQGVGEHHAPHQVVVEVLLDRPPDRLLEQHPPGRLVVDAGAQLRPGRQRFGEGGEDLPGDPPGRPVEGPPAVVLALRAGQPREGLPGAGLVAADEQPAGAAAALDGRVRGHRALAYREAQAQVADDLRREEGDEVRVARQPGVDAREGAGGDRGPAGAAEAFQDQDRAARPGQVRGGHQAVVPAAHDHGVVHVPVGTSALLRLPVREAVCPAVCVPPEAGHGSW